jgi:hypothetical protein
MRSGKVNTDQLRGLAEDAKTMLDEAAERIEDLETDNADLKQENERLRELLEAGA